MQTLSLAVADIVAFVAISILVVSFGLLAWAAYTDFTSWGKTAMINKNDVYNHIGEALQSVLPEDGSVEVGMDHNKLFLRMGGQVFAISIEEKQQFAKVGDPETAARNFMATLPIPFKSAR